MSSRAGTMDENVTKIHIDTLLAYSRNKSLHTARRALLDFIIAQSPATLSDIVERVTEQLLSPNDCRSLVENMFDAVAKTQTDVHGEMSIRKLDLC